MNQQFNFKCANGGLEEIPLEVVENNSFLFPRVHLYAEDMIKLCMEIKEYNGSEYVQVPFCLTVEAEALGAKINLGDNKNGPRISEYAFKSIDELDNLERLDHSKNRIREVLETVQFLANEGEKVILKIQGPYTIAQSLIDAKLLFKAVRKEKYRVEKLLTHIEDAIVDYIKEGIRSGAKIISYGDSSGTLDILGPKMYEELCGKYNINVLKRASEAIEDGLIHVCGVTSASLQNSGLIRTVSIKLIEELTYGEAINKVISENKNIKIIGHSCIKRLNVRSNSHEIWAIEF